MKQGVSAIMVMAGCGILAAPVAAQSQDGEQTAEAADIIVTAQRRASRIQDTPIALSALTGEEMRERGTVNLSDVAQTVPSLSFAQSFGISQVFIRGVGNNFFAPGGDPGVATYADGVYLSDQEATAVAFLDLDRIEVLRGPQGALYGRNATGGAINLVSAGPSEELSGRVGARFGDYGRIEADGFVTGALTDGISARASVQYRRLEGFTSNELPGTADAPGRLDAEESIAGRIQLKARLGEGSLRFIGNIFSQDDAGPALKILPDTTPQPAELLFGVRPSDDPRSLKSQLSRNRRDVWSTTLILEQPVGSADLTVIGDYRESDRVISYDQDGTEADVSRTTLDTTSNQMSLEGYLKGTSGALDWLVGANWMRFEQSRTTSVSGLLPGVFLNPQLPPTFPVPFQFDGGGTVTTKAWAVYADLAYQVSDMVRLRAGGRYNKDSKRAEEFLIFFGPPVEGTNAQSWGEWSGKAGIDFTPRDGVLLYGSVARGFKSGALNVGAFTPPVDPEIITSFEVGAKYETDSRRFQANVAAFTNDYSDLQIVQIGPLSQILANAADSRINGVELEMTARPTDRLTLAFTGAYLDATFGDFSATDQRRGFQTFDLTGNQLPLVSKWQASVNGRWEAPLSGGSRIGVNGTIGLRSEYFFTEFNTADARQGDVLRIDLGISWTSADERIRLSAFGRNLTDQAVLGSLAIVSPLLGSVRVASLEPPRSFGFGIDFNF